MEDFIKAEAKKLGFDLIGFSSVDLDLKAHQALQSWLEKGYSADMRWMQYAGKHPTELLCGAKTVICLAMNYYRDQKPLQEGFGRVAQYAYGLDYHKVIKDKQKELIITLQALAPDEKFYACVDSTPLLERAYAMQAGLGFIGKNSLLITEFGSYVFLAEIITTLDLKKSTPQELFSHCGSCTRCLDTCPTKAIVAAGVVDSRQCISYATIEVKNELGLSMKKVIKKTKRVFGCDICQEVCPHNIFKSKQNTLFNEPIAGDMIALGQHMSHDTFKNKFKNSPLLRSKTILNTIKDL